MESYTVRSDIRKNRIYCSLTGFVSDEECKSFADEVIAEAKKLKPDFTVINDITTFRPASHKGHDEIKRAAVFMAQHGLKRLIRIVSPTNHLAKMQFKHLSETLYHADTATSLSEAESMLDQ
jgi:hypothetical protein